MPASQSWATRFVEPHQPPQVSPEEKQPLKDRQEGLSDGQREAEKRRGNMRSAGLKTASRRRAMRGDEGC